MKTSEWQNLANKTVERLFLIVFPPYGEESMLQVDIRLGFVLKEHPEDLITIGTDVNEIWSPILTMEPIPNHIYPDSCFNERMEQWMKQEIDDPFLLEYYEVTPSNLFKEIIGKPIKEVHALHVGGIKEPFGIKFIFENDFILSLPNADGNTIETKNFNKNEPLKAFLNLGDITSQKI